LFSSCVALRSESFPRLRFCRLVLAHNPLFFLRFWVCRSTGVLSLICARRPRPDFISSSCFTPDSDSVLVSVAWPSLTFAHDFHRPDLVSTCTLALTVATTDLTSSAVSHRPVLRFSVVKFHFLSDRVIFVLTEFDVCSHGSGVRSGLNLSATASVLAHRS
jgi:hypothetical protein